MQNKDFFSGVPIEVREFLLRLLKEYLHEKIKKWITLAAAVVLAVTSLPVTAFAEKKDSTDDKMLTKITLNSAENL